MAEESHSDRSQEVEGAEDVDVSQEESTALAALIDIVHERYTQKKFPIIMPEELLSEDKQMAQDTFNLVAQSEHVALQKFLEDKFILFQASDPAKSKESEKVCRCKWSTTATYQFVS
jgi:hypothetical protein